LELRMSRKERDRLKVMASLEAGRVKQVEAARLLRLSPSYAVKKILAAFGCREAAWRGREAGGGLKIACSEDLASCGPGV